jgi:hypothetical protein
MTRRARRWLIGIGLFLVVWIASAGVGAAAQNPFSVAVGAAASAGGWPAESVRLRSGSYTALPFVFLTRAEVMVSGLAGERPAEIKIIHIPLLRFYEVRSFRRSL